MTETSAAGSAAEMAEATEAGGAEAARPNYVAVWGGLALLTLAEVWIATHELERTMIILVLVGLAIWKAGLVALYFMHLKFEPKRLWILALAPLPLAVILVMAVLQEF